MLLRSTALPRAVATRPTKPLWILSSLGLIMPRLGIRLRTSIGESQSCMVLRLMTASRSNTIPQDPDPNTLGTTTRLRKVLPSISDSISIMEVTTKSPAQHGGKHRPRKDRSEMRMMHASAKRWPSSRTGHRLSVGSGSHLVPPFFIGFLRHFKCHLIQALVGWPFSLALVGTGVQATTLKRQRLRDDAAIAILFVSVLNLGPSRSDGSLISCGLSCVYDTLYLNSIAPGEENGDVPSCPEPYIYGRRIWVPSRNSASDMGA